MAEQFEREGKNFSAEEVTKMRGLVMDVREVMDWDWGSWIGTIEESDLIDKAKIAIKDIEGLFGMEKLKFWADFPAEDGDMDERVRIADEYNRKELPAESMTLASGVVEKLKSDISAVQDVIEWDVDPGDEDGWKILRSARESLDELTKLI